MRVITSPRPAITPQSPKEINKIEAGITRAEIEEYFLYDSINPANRKRRMSRRMATHLRKMVSQSKHETIAQKALPPGWFEAIHQPMTSTEVKRLRRIAAPSEVGKLEGIPQGPELAPRERRLLERHREIVAARHEAVMRLVAMEQAKAKGGANR